MLNSVSAVSLCDLLRFPRCLSGFALFFILNFRCHLNFKVLICPQSILLSDKLLVLKKLKSFAETTEFSLKFKIFQLNYFYKSGPHLPPQDRRVSQTVSFNICAFKISKHRNQSFINNCIDQKQLCLTHEWFFLSVDLLQLLISVQDQTTGLTWKPGQFLGHTHMRASTHTFGFLEGNPSID